MSIHEHVYLEDIDPQLAVVFIVNESNESLTSLHICAISPEPLLLAFNTVNRFLPVRRGDSCLCMLVIYHFKD